MLCKIVLITVTWVFYPTITTDLEGQFKTGSMSKCPAYLFEFKDAVKLAVAWIICRNTITSDQQGRKMHTKHLLPTWQLGRV